MPTGIIGAFLIKPESKAALRGRIEKMLDLAFDSARLKSEPDYLAVELAEATAENVVAGSVLAHNIYTTDGRMYLPAGSELTPRITNLLRDLSELGTISPVVRVNER